MLSGKDDARLYYQQPQEVLKLYTRREYKHTVEEKALTQLVKLLSHYPKPHNALRQLLTYFDNQQIITPSYRKL